MRLLRTFMLKITQFNSFQPEQLNRSIDAETLAGAQTIVDTVRDGGETALRQYANQFGERTADQPLVIGPDQLKAAADRIDSNDLASVSYTHLRAHEDRG